AEAVFRAAPVTAVRLEGQPSPFDVAECAALASVRRLTVTFDELHSGGVAALNASPHLARLEALDLGRLDETEVLPGTKPLRLEGLRYLNLSGNRIEPEWGEVLAASPFLTGLTSLILDGNGGPLGEDGLAAWLASPNCASLACLDLSDNVIGDRGAALLADCP